MCTFYSQNWYLVLFDQIKVKNGQDMKRRTCCTPAPFSPNTSRKLGGTAGGGVQECAGSPLPKNAPAYLAQTFFTH